MKIEDVPQYPETLTFVPLEESSNRIFAFIAVFPNGRRLTVKATYPSVGRVDIAHAKEFATRLVEKLLIERDEPGVRKTNWVSAIAAIQRMMIDFNDRRSAAQSAPLADTTIH